VVHDCEVEEFSVVERGRRGEGEKNEYQLIFIKK